MSRKLHKYRTGHDIGELDTSIEFAVDLSLELPSEIQNQLIYQANLAAEWLMASAPSRIEHITGTLIGASESEVAVFAEDLESRFDSLLGRVWQFAQVADQMAEV